LLNFSEQMLYSVDEWLRFRQGESRVSMVAKMILGVVWFFVTYIIRVFINLFIEPTFNPIKHFPVVTVAAKLIFPMVLPVTTAIEPIVGRTVAGLIAAFCISLLPGLAGFLVWELKENWRLYRANRAPTLRPALVGHHGETVTRLLKRGFHSGTVPKLYGKLRKDWRKAIPSGAWRTFRKHREALQAVEQAIHSFFEREFIALLHGSKGWGTPRLAIDAIHLSCSRITVALASAELGPEPVAIGFTVEEGMLVAQLLEPGWLPHLTPEQVNAFRLALAGQYKLAGAQVVAAPAKVSIATVALPWDEWVEAWEQDQAGNHSAPALLNAMPLFPTTTCPSPTLVTSSP
jgi:hypothetical protein